MRRTAFRNFAWGVLAYTVFVILIGAFVRATGSGAGCGSHWPLCNGEVVPLSPSLEELVEYTHRLTSGLALLAVLALFVWAWRAYPPRHRVRAGAAVSFFFMVIEALIGAGLVLLEYVASNVSIARAYWMAGHLLNTFLLLGALTLTAWWASGGAPLRLRGQGVVGGMLALALFGMAVLGASGGITALGDTLILTAGISPEESPIVATLQDLRIYHPLLAFVVGAIMGAAAWVAYTTRPGPQIVRFGRRVVGLFVAQLLLGALNVALKAPVWLQLAHLLLADLIWILLVLLAAVALAGQSVSERAESTVGVVGELRTLAGDG
ncbi:MAG: cytochrome oxidase assembly protein [Chloroflexi bacterium]|nr:MAG: cytochrome oxidase assembly protein [Chloroflexota bacterium]